MKDFKRFLNKIESIVLALSIVGVIFLIMQLGFIKNMEMPTFYEEYEYNEINEIKNENGVGYIVLQKNTDENRKLPIKVNGKGNYKFDSKNELMLKVSDGSVIEIYNNVHDEEIEIKVVGVSKNVVEPKLNEIFRTNEGIKISFKVKLN